MTKEVTKALDEMFCPSCGKLVKKDAVICVNCGVQIGKMTGNHIPKSKTTAILLAIFLSFWTWLYTYQKDAWKFWLNLVLSVVTLGIWQLVCWPWSIIETATRSNDYYLRFPNE